MKKVERPDRGENCALNRCLPLRLLDTQELQQGFNMEGIDQAADSHHPREHMHRPPLLSVMAQGLLERTIRLLLSHSCCQQLGRMDIRRAAEVYDGYPLVMRGYQNPIRLPPAPLVCCGERG